MLAEMVEKHGTNVWLINTGERGGKGVARAAEPGACRASVPVELHTCRGATPMEKVYSISSSPL